MQLSAEQLEKFRTIGLRLDRAGVFHHAGAVVTHPRLRQALLRWLDIRAEDGRDIIRLDDERYAYVEVDDAHLRARSAHWEGDRVLVLWDDEVERELEYGSLRQAEDNALYVTVGKLRGRIAGPAYHAITERIAELPDGAFALRAASGIHPIATSRS